jgi:GNAT superfamily N-acetyltransferase
MTETRPSHLKLYRSSLSDEPLTLRGAALAVVSREEIPRRPAFRGSIRLADLDNAHDLKAIEAINELFWGCMDQDVFGRNYKILECDNLLALPAPDEPGATDASCHGIAGNVAVTEEKEGWLHVVVFQVWPIWHGRGVGRKLLDAAIAEARRRGLRSIKLGTTNDNLPAMYFYQRAGFVMEELVPEETAEALGIAPTGFAGIPIRSEIRLRLDVG